MDAKFVDDVRSRMVYEAHRQEPPEGFPRLPDLPLDRYRDTAFHAAEIEHVFKRTWLYAGHVSDYAEPGAYRALDIPIAPIVVVRGLDGEVRAFLNACRHRGAPVVRDPAGVAKHLVCQFHAWSYDLAGRLVGVPDERDFVCLEKGDRGLVPVRCETWGGFVFINLDRDAMPLREWLAPLVDRYSDLMESELRPVVQDSWEIRCNWKVAIEAFIEIYHLRVVHKNTVHRFIDTRGGVIMMHPNGHGSMFTPYRPEILQSSPEVMETFFPNDPAVVPQVSGLSGLYREANPSFNIFPNLVSPSDITGFPIFVWWPLDVGRTRMDMYWFGPPWGDGPRPPGWDVKLAMWEALIGEDNVNLEPIQRSIDAAAQAGVPLNYQERRIWQFHADIDRMIGPERVPEHLRVPDLLARYVER